MLLFACHALDDFQQPSAQLNYNLKYDEPVKSIRKSDVSGVS